MAIEDKQAQLMGEAQALKHFYGITSDRMKELFKAFSELYESTDDTHSDEFYDALNAIDDEIEDLCLSKGIVQERLEERMEADDSWMNVEL